MKAISPKATLWLFAFLRVVRHQGSSPSVRGLSVAATNRASPAFTSHIPLSTTIPSISSTSTALPISSSPPPLSFASTVLNFLDSESIEWKAESSSMGVLSIPETVRAQCPLSTFVLLPQSGILLHLIPSPRSLQECLPPTLNRQLTQWCLHNYNYHHDVCADDDNNNIDDQDSTTTKSHHCITKIIHLHQDIWESKREIVQNRIKVQSGGGGAIGGGGGVKGQHSGFPTQQRQRRYFARKTVVRKLIATQARAFLTKHHLWSATQARYHYGLYEQENKNKSNNTNDKNGGDDESSSSSLLAVATFSKKRHVLRNGVLFHSYELIRYCSRQDCTVVGGISKLLKHFVRERRRNEEEETIEDKAGNTANNDVNMDIVTMVDRDWGPATGWKELGFASMQILDTLVMAVDKAGNRRYLLGAGLEHEEDMKEQDDAAISSFHTEKARRQKQSGLKPRLGLPRRTLDALQKTADAEEALQCLSNDGFYPVYDAGVERLFLVVPPDEMPSQSQQEEQNPNYADLLWETAEPKYAQRYYSSNTGIVSLLENAASETLDRDRL